MFDIFVISRFLSREQYHCGHDYWRGFALCAGMVYSRQGTFGCRQLAEEADVTENCKTAEVTGAFDNYKRGTENEVERLKSELETAQIAASDRISETEVNDLNKRISQLGLHINDRETDYSAMERCSSAEESAKNTAICNLDSAI